MHVEYIYPKTKSYKNQAMLNDQYIDAGLFLGDIMKGFTEAYEMALRGKQELAERITPYSIGKSRYVVRQTQRYTMLLQSSYHPDVMTDGRNPVSYTHLTYDYERIDMGSHSWVEQVPYRSCKNREELQRYYQRIGIQLFLCYL